MEEATRPKPRGIGSGQIAPWASASWCGSVRPDTTPPAKQAFDGPKAKNQKPPSGKKLGAARVCDPIGKF